MACILGFFMYNLHLVYVWHVKNEFGHFLFTKYLYSPYIDLFFLYMVYIDLIMKKTMDLDHLYIVCIVNMLSI